VAADSLTLAQGLSPLQKSDREEVLGEWLDERGVADAWDIAPVFAEAALDTAWLDRVGAAMAETGGSLDHAVRWLSYTVETELLMNEIAGKRPPATTRERVDPLHQLSQTLGEHYQKKQAFYAFKPPKTYDRDLSRLFSADPRHRREQPASVFIRRHRAQIRQVVARWTGENQLTLDAVLDDMISRCRELELRAAGSERKLLINFTILLTAKTVQTLFGPSRRKWIAL